MPKKRKKTTGGNTSGKPGVTTKFLSDNFSSLPGTENFLNGHVLFLFITCSRKRGLTVKKLLSLIIPPVPQNQVVTVRERLAAGVKRVVSQTLDKYKNLSNANQLQVFDDICRKKFSFDVHASPSASASKPGTSKVPCAKSPEKPKPKSPKKTRQTEKCKSCRNYRTTLKNMELKYKQKQLGAKNMTANKKKKNAVKVLNQTIKRRDAKIQQLKETFEASTVGQDLLNTKSALSSVEKKHKKLKRANKIKKAGLTKRLSEEFEQTKSALKSQLAEKDKEICSLQHENLVLEEQVRGLQAQSKEVKADGKSFSSNMRMMVFDAVINQVPTNNIPKLLEKFSARCGLNFSDVPHRTTVESMARELGAISELQTAEAVLANKNCTLGFDATTQEGVHINSVHVTTETNCYSVAVDELPGGTAADYHLHICDSVDNLATTYCHFNNEDYPQTRKKIISNITNSMTDRCAANHAAIELVNSSWDKTLNELNCHLHPLDSLATKTRTALKQQEQERDVTSKLFGTECIASKIVLQMNKLRFKDGKGDPRGFKAFLDQEHLPRGLIPRYRGNRLHVLFHIAGVLIHYHAQFRRYLEKGTSCGGLRKSLHDDFVTTTAHVELQVLGLIGKLLTGPWMRAFYTSAKDQMEHIEGIGVVRDIINNLKKASPLELLKRSKDFFGNALHEPTVDCILKSLTEPPRDQTLFEGMMRSCLQSIVEVLERQYEKYFECDLTEKLKEETKSARSHNIDAEEIMGMFSAAKTRAPNATICYISSKMRAQKNKTVEYLDDLCEERREVILKKAVKLGQKQRNKRRLKQTDLRAELLRREAEKQQAQEAAGRRKIERKLKTTALNKLDEEFPDIGEEKLEKLTELLSGKSVGKLICHSWYEDGNCVVYNGKLEKLKAQGKKYVVGYWSQEESYDDATDYDMSVFELGADFIADDLLM